MIPVYRCFLWKFVPGTFSRQPILMFDTQKLGDYLFIKINQEAYQSYLSINNKINVMDIVGTMTTITPEK